MHKAAGAEGEALHRDTNLPFCPLDSFIFFSSSHFLLPIIHAFIISSFKFAFFQNPFPRFASFFVVLRCSFFLFVFAVQLSMARCISRTVLFMQFNLPTLALIYFCVRIHIVKRIHFLCFSIMQLWEWAINSLENVLHEPGRCFNRWTRVCPDEAGVICIQGQQSSRNYELTSANGSEESTQILFTLWTCSACWSEARVKSKTLNTNHAYAGKLLVNI